MARGVIPTGNDETPRPAWRPVGGVVALGGCVWSVAENAVRRGDIAGIRLGCNAVSDGFDVEVRESAASVTYQNTGDRCSQSGCKDHGAGGATWNGVKADDKSPHGGDRAMDSACDGVKVSRLQVRSC